MASIWLLMPDGPRALTSSPAAFSHFRRRSAIEVCPSCFSDGQVPSGRYHIPYHNWIPSGTQNYTLSICHFPANVRQVEASSTARSQKGGSGHWRRSLLPRSSILQTAVWGRSKAHTPHLDSSTRTIPNRKHDSSEGCIPFTMVSGWGSGQSFRKKSLQFGGTHQIPSFRWPILDSRWVWAFLRGSTDGEITQGFQKWRLVRNSAVGGEDAAGTKTAWTVFTWDRCFVSKAFRAFCGDRHTCNSNVTSYTVIRDEWLIHCWNLECNLFGSKNVVVPGLVVQ